MVKRLAAFAVLTAAITVFATAAHATKPIRGPAASPPSFTFPAGMVCAFPVFAEALVNNQVETIFSSGKIQYTGLFVSRVVNLLNDKEVTLNTSGPARIVEEGSNLRLTTSGPLLFFFFPGDAGPGDESTGRTYYIRGRTEVLIVPATFEFLSFSYTGNAVDICAQLA